MVTVETAVALGAFLAVLASGLGAVVGVLDQVRCVDAAREAARLVARGERARAPVAVSRIGPDGARLSVRTSGDEVTVHVRADPLNGLLPGVHNDGVAYAVREPG